MCSFDAAEGKAESGTPNDPPIIYRIACWARRPPFGVQRDRRLDGGDPPGWNVAPKQQRGGEQDDRGPGSTGCQER